jgi:hypothetical protein
MGALRKAIVDAIKAQHVPVDICRLVLMAMLAESLARTATNLNQAGSDAALIGKVLVHASMH